MTIAAQLPTTPAAGLIGPNAVLQLLPLLDEAFGSAETRRLLAIAGMQAPPSDRGLMSELPAAALHRALRREHPREAPALLATAGRRTADYVMAHRIPGPAKVVLQGLPGVIAGPMLVRAVARHAWTFAGSGLFAVESLRPMVVTLQNNPLIAGEQADAPLCAWHQAVFERLFSALAHQRARCEEVECQAAGAAACRFIVS